MVISGDNGEEQKSEGKITLRHNGLWVSQAGSHKNLYIMLPWENLDVREDSLKQTGVIFYNSFTTACHMHMFIR